MVDRPDRRQVLINLPLSEVSDNPGIRIRWAELYALLRAPIADKIIYGAELQDCGRDENGLFVGYVDRSNGGRKRLELDRSAHRRRRSLLAGPRSFFRHGSARLPRRLPVPVAVSGGRRLSDRRLRPMVQRSQPAARVPRPRKLRLLRGVVPPAGGRRNSRRDEAPRGSQRLVHARQRPSLLAGQISDGGDRTSWR